MQTCFFKVLRIISIPLIMLFFTASDCNKNNSGAGPGETNPLVGTWICTNVDLEFYNGPPGNVGLSIIVTIKADGTFSMIIDEGAGPENETGTWTATETVISFYPDDNGGESEDYTYQYINNNQFTVEAEVSGIPAVLTFSRQ